MKIIRVICYEGDLKDLQRQMASSMPDCKRSGTEGVTIEIRTVVDERPKPEADVIAAQVKKMMGGDPQQFSMSPCLTEPMLSRGEGG